MTVRFSWRDQYVFADGETFRRQPERLLLHRDEALLSLARAEQVLARLALEAPAVLARLCTAFDVPRVAGGDSEQARELSKWLGPPWPDCFALPGPFARLLVFEFLPPRAPSAAPRPKPPAPRPLAEIAASLTLQLVDEWGNPLSGPSYALNAADGSTRAGRFDAQGSAQQQGLPPGIGELSLPELHAGDVQARAAPPDGWLQDELSISLRDVGGDPISGLRVQVMFDDGSTRTATLDETGNCRLTGIRSGRLCVQALDFDPEAWT
jgi:hypothetical protein